MRIIDEKGRLFGKINIIDFLIIFLLFFITPVFYFEYKLFKKDVPVKPAGFFKTIEIPCVLINIKPEVFKVVARGDKEIDQNQVKIGEIISIGDVRPHIYKIMLGKNEFKSIEDGVLKDVPVVMKIDVSIEENRAYYKDRLISLDSAFDFNTDKYSVQVMPMASGMEKWVKVRVRFSGIPPELSKIVNTGHIEKDDSGRLMGVLDKIIDTSPSQVSALRLEENKFVYINDPFRNDFVVLLNLLCTESVDGLYFKNYPIKIGSQINFSTDLYVISGSIIGFDK